MREYKFPTPLGTATIVEDTPQAYLKGAKKAPVRCVIMHMRLEYSAPRRRIIGVYPTSLKKGSVADGGWWGGRQRGGKVERLFWSAMPDEQRSIRMWRWKEIIISLRGVST
jgi:hypothetical protein